MAKPYKPDHLLKSKMVPVRMTDGEFRFLEAASVRLGVSISVLMREGAKVYARQLEQKGEPRKEGK